MVSTVQASARPWCKFIGIASLSQNRIGTRTTMMDCLLVILLFGNKSAFKRQTRIGVDWRCRSFGYSKRENSLELLLTFDGTKNFIATFLFRFKGLFRYAERHKQKYMYHNTKFQIRYSSFPQISITFFS